MKTIYEEKAEEIGKLVSQKNTAYGSSFAESHKILEVLYPQGIAPHQFTDALAIIRVIDKLFRIATKKDAFGESPWQDIAGYGLLGSVKADNESRQMATERNKKMDILTEETKKRK
jgi:hypothetical protein